MDSITNVILTFSVLLMLFSLGLFFLYFPTSQSKDLNLKNKENKKILIQKKVLFDIAVRIVDFLSSCVVCFLISPILLLLFILLKCITNDSVIKRVPIVGLKEKKVTLYYFKITENAKSHALRSFLEYANFDGLLLLFNVIKGDISIFGLSRINYNDMNEAKNKVSNIFESYKYYRPGLVSFSFFRRQNKDEPYFESLHSANIEFLNNRSFKLLLQLLRKTIYLTFNTTD